MSFILSLEPDTKRSYSNGSKKSFPYLNIHRGRPVKVIFKLILVHNLPDQLAQDICRVEPQITESEQ